MSELARLADPEDHKLVTLARAARARTGAAEGAALRDTEGRTYAAATVDLTSLRVSAIGVAVVMALASGARGAEAVVVLTGADRVDPHDLVVLSDFAGSDVPVHRTDLRGTLADTAWTGERGAARA